MGLKIEHTCEIYKGTGKHLINALKSENSPVEGNFMRENVETERECEIGLNWTPTLVLHDMTFTNCLYFTSVCQSKQTIPFLHFHAIYGTKGISIDNMKSVEYVQKSVFKNKRSHSHHLNIFPHLTMYERSQNIWNISDHRFIIATATTRYRTSTIGINFTVCFNLFVSIHASAYAMTLNYMIWDTTREQCRLLLQLICVGKS